MKGKYRPYSMTSLNHKYELAHHEYTEQPPFRVAINRLWQYIRSIFLSHSSCRSCKFAKLAQHDNYLVPTTDILKRGKFQAALIPVIAAEPTTLLPLI